VQRHRSVTLGQTFLAAAALCGGVLSSAGAAFWQRSQRAALAASERSRQSVARAAEARVAAALGSATRVLDDVERALGAGIVPAAEGRGLEGLLYTELLGAERLSEVTFIGARPVEAGRAADDDAAPRLASDGRFRVSVFWTAEGQLSSAITERDGAGFVEQRWDRPPGDRRLGRAGAPRKAPASDPTEHPTFVASVAGAGAGLALWSDLHFSEIDRGAPRPRVVLTVQKAVRAPGVYGVVRVGLLAAALDTLSEQSIATDDELDPHRVALLATPAAEGPARLLTRTGTSDAIVSVDGELRVVPSAPPPAIAALLASPIVCGLDPDWPAREAELDVAGEPWLATLSPLSIAGGGTRGWLVAVLVPEGYYTRELAALGRALALPFAASSALLLAVAAGVLGVWRRGLARLGARTARMREFDFEADRSRSRLREIDELLESVERAKTVARAMCKYIPVPLVRGLYEKNREPELGAEPREVTLLFTDIQGFTSLAERVPADELARRLGCYLEVVTGTLERHGATIDKYIGDAVMAFWNAPDPVADHSARACRAVLACRQALAELYGSPAWGGAPALVTRFGLHRDRVLVGHFGAPTRLAYTALGDGVNLAARLESECKRHGVTALASASVVRAAGATFGFRPIDRVTVRGKTEPVEVYELTGEAVPSSRRDRAGAGCDE
jgi:adenylate cyclase